jgi:hypothetical protein
VRQTDNDDDYENHYSDYDHKQSLTSEQIARLQHQHYLNDQILRQQELMKEQQEAARSRQIEDYERQEQERHAYERHEKERQEQERQEQERRELARQQQEIINQEQMRQSVGSRAGRSSSKAEPITSKKSPATGSTASLSAQKDAPKSTKDRLKDFEKDYEVAPLKLIGKLRGKHVIKDQAHINDESLNEFNKIYENYEKQSQRESGAGEAKQRSDMFDLSYFQDEIIDVDYGAIDAYTAAINAHLTAEKNNEPAPTNLQFASHILKSSHATFVENQLFLGDNFRNNASTTIDDEQADSGRTKVNVKIFNPKLFGGGGQETRSNGSIGGDHTPTNTNQNNTTTNQNFDDYDQYSRSNSFGSVVDIQSQPAYSVADLNGGDLNNLSHILNSANKTTFNSDVYSNNNTIRSTSNFVNLNSSTNNNLNSNLNNNNNSSSNLNNVRSSSNMNNSMDSNIFNGLGKSKQSLSGIYNLDSLLTASLYQNR